MKKKIIITFILGLLGIFGAIGWIVLDTLSGYDALIREDRGPVVVKVESEMLVRLRQEVAESKWRIQASGDSEIASLLTEMGFSDGVEGVAELFEYQITPFDWKNLERNQLNLVIGTIRQGLIPSASGRVFHLNESRDFGVIFPHEGVAWFYHQTDAGLIDGILTNIPASSNK